MLFLTALIWGTALVSQSVAMEYMEPFTFCSARFMLSGAALVLFLALRKRIVGKESLLYRPEELREKKQNAWIGGLICGLFLFAASAFQQFGIRTTEAGKAGFLTALYIILVPIYSIGLGKRPHVRIWIAALIALVGLYFLCIEGSFFLEQGDLLCVISAFIYPLQILALDRYVMRTDTVMLSCVQFWTVGLLSLVMALMTETPRLSSLLPAGGAVLYAGVMSGAIAYTLQGVGQKRMQNPTAASLIMSLEAVFGVLAGWLLIGEALSPRKLLGCVILFCAIVLAQL